MVFHGAAIVFLALIAEAVLATALFLAAGDMFRVLLGDSSIRAQAES